MKALGRMINAQEEDEVRMTRRGMTKEDARRKTRVERQ